MAPKEQVGKYTVFLKTARIFLILGKSSLINSLRKVPNVKKTPDWQHNSSAGAPVGEIETTTELNWYECPQDDNARRYVRLWDVPGCGTLDCPTKNYFIDKHLYVFDCLIMVSAGNLGEYELNLINAAGAAGRMVIVVLSKSELKAESKARDRHDTTDLSVTDYQPIVEDTINEAKAHMQATIEKAKSKYTSLDVSKIFVVSSVKYREFFRNPNEINALLTFQTSKLLVYLLKTAKNKRLP